LTSTRFLVSTAVCCGLSVALALWAVGGASGGARALAGLIGLTASLAVMVLIAAAVSDGTAAAPEPPPAEAPVPPARVPEGHELLARRLDDARALRLQLRPGSTDARVDTWIEEVRTTIERSRPGVAGYFNALARRAYADDASRLDAHIRRLETIVSGS